MGAVYRINCEKMLAFVPVSVLGSRAILTSSSVGSQFSEASFSFNSDVARFGVPLPRPPVFGRPKGLPLFPTPGVFISSLRLLVKVGERLPTRSLSRLNVWQNGRHVQGICGQLGLGSLPAQKTQNVLGEFGVIHD